MWTSYEAICELGGPAGKPDEADDPNSIFGVDPPKLSPRNIDEFKHSFKVDKSNNNATAAASADAQHESFALNRYGTPSTPYSTFDNMTIGVNQTANSRFASVKGRESDIRNHLNRPATGSTVAPRSRAVGNETGGLPQTNLFNATPAVGASFRSPILETPAAKTPNTIAAPASAISYADSVLNKARRVASGLYYEPSPESTNPRLKSPHSAVHRSTLESRLNDLSAIPDATKLSFTNSPSTPNVPPPFHAGVSSVKGEKRALSPMEMESRKKFGQEKNEEDEVAEAREKTMTLKMEEGEMESNQELDSDVVGRVLQMLSTFGAAYKYLCQVRVLFATSFLIGFIHSHASSLIYLKVSISGCIGNL